MYDKNDDSRGRYGPALNQQQTEQLTSQLARVAAQAECLFLDLERYETIASANQLSTKRLTVVNALIDSLKEHLNSCQSETHSVWGRESREELRKKFASLWQFRFDVIADQKSGEEWLTRSRNEIVDQLAALRSAVDTLYSTEPTRKSSVPNEKEWNRVGKVHSAVGQIVHQPETFSVNRIADYALGIMELAGAVETHYLLSCVREDTQPRRDGIESLYRTRLGWRLGLPLSRRAIKVSLTHLVGSERQTAEEFIESPREMDGWVEPTNETEDSQTEEPPVAGAREIYAGIVAKREVFRPNSNTHEDLIVGAMLYHRMGNVYEINAIRVGDWERGHAVGTQLMTAFLNEIRLKGDGVNIIIDLPHATTIEGYSHARMCSFLHSFGFTAMPHWLEGYTRMKWEKQLCAPILDSLQSVRRT
jgi:predicted GNAT family acetyltransferase